MRRPFLKVCGITRLADALAAVEAGADAVGFVLVPDSPRFVADDEAATIARRLPPGIARVGVMVNRPPREVRARVERIGLTAVQAHGDETPETCAAYGLPTVKAVAAGEGFRWESLEPFRGFPVLFDAAGGGARGGTGLVSNWEQARLAREQGFRVLLAGGLGPGNLREAVEAVAPVAVDLNSGVESAPGRKDVDLIRAAAAGLDGLEPPEATSWPW